MVGYGVARHWEPMVNVHSDGYAVSIGPHLTAMVGVITSVALPVTSCSTSRTSPPTPHRRAEIATESGDEPERPIDLDR